MPYIYNSSALLSASVSDNLQPMAVPPVNRYLYPFGADTGGMTATNDFKTHIPIRAVLYVPFKLASTITVDRLGMHVVDLGGITDVWYYDMALYTHNSTDNYPATKIADLGTFTWDPATASPGTSLMTINQTLQANTTYWLGVGIRQSTAYPGPDVMNNRTPITPQITGDYALFRKRGIGSAATITGGIAWMEQIPFYSGTMPATTQYSNNQSQLSTMPRFVFRRSA